MNVLTKKQKKTGVRIIVVFICFVVLMILTKTGVLGPVPGPVVFLLWFVPYLVIGYDVLGKAFRNIAHGQVFDEHFLMMVATFAAFGLGIMGDGSYSEALAVMLFYQVGELFQDYATGRARRSITEMMSIAPEYANLVQADGSVEEADPEDVHAGDTIVIKPGEKVPLDGVVIEGSSFLNTAALTGESVPRRAGEGDDVISGCVNQDGTLKVRVTKEYEDSTVAKILDLVENASTRKARLENFITRFAKYYTPVVTFGAVAMALIPALFLGMPWSDSIRRACNFLIVSCPCALVISVPLGFFGGIGAASKIGVLVKGSNYLEAAAEMSTIVMDKTGTLTKGEFRVQKVLPAEGFALQPAVQQAAGSAAAAASGNAAAAGGAEAAHRGTGKDSAAVLLEIAALGEGFSTHPIAQSIEAAYEEETGKKPDLSRVSDAGEEAGHGIHVKVDGNDVLLGNEKLMKARNVAGFTPADGSDNTIAAGTLVYVAVSGKYAGVIVISDTVKEGAAEAIAAMKKAGITKTVMLTGDRKAAAEAVAAKIGIDEVYAELLPADKVDRVEALLKAQQEKDPDKKVGFVGDGINDAPVLMRSDVGFAMGLLGSDAAIEAADIVLMDDDIRKIAKVVQIARKTMRIVRANVVFAIGVKLLILVLSVFGLASMWAAVFGDVGVACLCVLNSMRALKIDE